MENKPSIYTHTTEVFIQQCDFTSQLKITEINNICQTTAIAHSFFWGMDYVQMQKYNQVWVLSGMRIEIEKLPYCTQTIESKTWIQEIQETRAIRNFSLKHNDQTLANISSLWVVINTQHRKPEPLAVPISDLKLFPEEKATETPLQRININIQAQKIATHTVKYSDLDIIGHVNNIKYMEWCLDLLPISYLLEKKIKAIDLNFMKELKAGDKVEILQTHQPDGIYFYIQKEKTMIFAMRVEVK